MPQHEPFKEKRLTSGAFSFRPAFIFLLLGVVLALTVLAYTPGLQGPFILDDQSNIEHTALESLSWDEVQLKLMSGTFWGFSRIVTHISFALTQFASGYDAPTYKYQNLLLHLTNGLLIFWLAALLIQVREQRPVSAPSAYWQALLISAIWLLHPLQVSTVLYSVQRLVILSAFFSLLSLICYIKGRLLIGRQPKAGLAVMLVGLLAFWPLAIFSKENAALLAPAALLTEWLILRFEPHSQPARRIVITVVALFFVLPLLLLLLLFALRTDLFLTGYGGRDFTLTERILTQVHALWFYLSAILFPVPAQMGLYHDDFEVQHILDVRTALGGIALFALISVGVASRRFRPLIAFGILWFFCWHLIESTILPLEMVFEHRNYLALFGLVLAGVAAGKALHDRPKLRRPAEIGALSLVLLLGLNTASRSFGWSSYEMLSRTEFLRAPNSVRAVEGMFILAKSQGDQAAARSYIYRLQALSPNDAWPLLKDIFERCADADLPDSLKARALQNAATGTITPALVNALRRLNTAVASSQCPAVSPNFVLQLTALIATSSKSKDPTLRMAAYSQWASLSAQAGDFETAQRALRSALTLAAAESPSRLHQMAWQVGQVASEINDADASIAFIKATTEGFGEDLMRIGTNITARVTAGEPPSQP